MSDDGSKYRGNSVTNEFSLGQQATWIRLRDDYTGINKTLSHPWLFLEDGKYDRNQTCFSRTTHPYSKSPPQSIKVPSHSERHVCFVDKNAWIDFWLCKPTPQFESELTRFRSRGIRPTEALKSERREAKTCRSEDEIVVTRILSSFRKYKGIEQ
jgi:hypothetical protein